VKPEVFLSATGGARTGLCFHKPLNGHKNGPGHSSLILKRA
jgi:hypothetical protein